MKNIIIKQDLVDWKKLIFIQSDSLKEMTKQSFEKLKASLKNNGFVQPFNIWQDGDKLYCLDGYHRQKAMLDLEKEGIEIPNKLPANFINCKNKKEATKLVLVYSSIYARVTDKGFYEFLDMSQLNYEDLKTELDLPGLEYLDFDIMSIPNREKEIDMNLEITNECPRCGYKWS